MKIAQIEDNREHAKLMKSWLEQDGHQCIQFERGSLFVAALESESFDLVVLDWNLPDLQGDELIPIIRQRCGADLPILFATANDREEDVARILELGADDYMVKPVRYREMLARIHALQRRFHKTRSIEQLVHYPPFSFDLINREVSMQGETISTTQKEFELMLFLFRNRNRLVSRSEILSEVWGQNAEIHTRTVDTHICRIRKKLFSNPANGWKIVVVYQFGYRLESCEAQQNE